MAMLLYAGTRPRNVRPGDVDDDDVVDLKEPSREDFKAAVEQERDELEACVSLAKRLYNLSGADQV
jgi:hypothetical protein